MADDGYLVGFEDSNGNFVEVGRLNNTAEDVTQPFEIKHADSGNTVELGPNGFNLVNVDLDLSGNNISNVSDIDVGSVSTGQLNLTRTSTKTKDVGGGVSDSVAIGPDNFGNPILITVRPEDNPDNDIGIARDKVQTKAGDSFYRVYYTETEDSGGGSVRIDLWEIAEA